MVALALGGCTLVSRIDTCDAPSEHDFQVNGLADGDQYPSFGRGLAALAGGTFVATWASEANPTDGAPSEVRAALFQADGRVVSPCGSAVSDLAISVAANEIVGRPVVAASLAPNQPIYFAWRATPAGVPAATARGSIHVRLMRPDLCPWNPPPLDRLVFTVDDGLENAAAPALAVRSDGQEAMVSWVSVATPFLLREIPVGVRVDHVGRVEANPCDGHEAPCTVASGATISPPTITAAGLGYALAWGESRRDGVTGIAVRLRVLDQTGTMTAEGMGTRPFGSVNILDLSSVASDTTIAVVEAAEITPGESHPIDENVFLERFDMSAHSLGAVQQVNDSLAGSSAQPAIALVQHDAALVTWITHGADGMSSSVWARYVSASGEFLFNGFACDTTQFPLSTADHGGFTGPSVLATTDSAVVLFGATSAAPGGSDGLGLSVHARHLPSAHAVPALRQ